MIEAATKRISRWSFNNFLSLIIPTDAYLSVLENASQMRMRLHPTDQISLEFACEEYCFFDGKILHLHGDVLSHVGGVHIASLYDSICIQTRPKQQENAQ